MEEYDGSSELKIDIDPYIAANLKALERITGTPVSLICQEALTLYLIRPDIQERLAPVHDSL